MQLQVLNLVFIENLRDRADELCAYRSSHGQLNFPSHFQLFFIFLSQLVLSRVLK
jgi:hypothetical protein